MNIYKCSICGNEGNFTSYIIKEMLCGIGGEFKYFQCDNCECLQIENIPKEISNYYPDNYYAYTDTKQSGFTNFIRQFKFKQKAIEYKYKKKRFLNIFGAAFCIFFKENLPPIEPEKDIFDKKILDIGCGIGNLVKTLRNIGFKNITGVEPFINNDIYDDNNILLVKNTYLENIEGKYDIIMLNHSLEHMPDQTKTINKIYELLNDDGQCIITIPTVSSWAWYKYKENWFNLDAPRHFYLHSIKSITKLAENANFKIEKLKYNSNHQGITYSEIYRKYTNFINKKNYISHIINTIKSKHLNSIKKGDVITVYLKK